MLTVNTTSCLHRASWVIPELVSQLLTDGLMAPNLPFFACFAMLKHVSVNTSPLLARSYGLYQQKVLERLCKDRTGSRDFPFFS